MALVKKIYSSVQYYYRIKLKLEKINIAIYVNRKTVYIVKSHRLISLLHILYLIFITTKLLAFIYMRESRDRKS